ncbi:hypothetical protein [Microbacterium indicum]|uniref:hypothetical protein n=1 Tax=Microbacterium indicum TaxID=358100 RepID=UPI0004243F0A|nr:hypothetical protein [Microbacterium indicum]
MQMWAARVVSWVIALVAGAVFGAAGTITHSITAWGWLPVGMLVGGLACAALLVALRLLVDGRGESLAAAVGMLGTLMLFSGEGPGGSVVVPAAADGAFPFGVVWSFVLAGIVLVVVAWPDMRRIRALQSGHASSH